MAVFGEAGAAVFVVFVVHEEVFLVVGVEDLWGLLVGHSFYPLILTNPALVAVNAAVIFGS